MRPKRRSSFLGDGLLVTYGLVTYYLVTQWRVVYDPRNSQVYAAAVLLWLALSLFGLGRIAFVLIRPARERPTGGDSRPSPDSIATPTSEERHDHYFDCDDEERNDSARARR
ncbi:MAG: hypothetical protein ABTD50_24270 [Polyangiaceae bacterium]|jgi:hypothetical protein